MIGYPLARLIVPTGDVDEVAGLLTLNNIEGALLIVIAVIAAVFFRERPPTSPSRARDEEEEGDMSFRSFVRLLQARKAVVAFSLLSVVFALACSVLWTTSILLQQDMAWAGYDDSQVMIPGTALLFAGLMAMPAAGKFVDATRSYRPTIIALLVLSTLASVGVWLFLMRPSTDDPGVPINVALATCLTFVAGGLLSALQPACLELAAVMTYPASPSQSCSVLYVVTQVIALAVSLVSAKLQLPDGDMRWSNLFMACAALSAALLFLCFRSKYWRFEVQDEGGAGGWVGAGAAGAKAGAETGAGAEAESKYLEGGLGGGVGSGGLGSRESRDSRASRGSQGSRGGRRSVSNSTHGGGQGTAGDALLASAASTL